MRQSPVRLYVIADRHPPDGPLDLAPLILREAVEKEGDEGGVRDPLVDVVKLFAKHFRPVNVVCHLFSRLDDHLRQRVQEFSFTNWGARLVDPLQVPATPSEPSQCTP